MSDERSAGAVSQGSRSGPPSGGPGGEAAGIAAGLVDVVANRVGFAPFGSLPDDFLAILERLVPPPSSKGLKRAKGLSLTRTTQLLRRGEMTSQALVEASLRNAADRQPQLNCFIDIEAESALAKAEGADRAMASGRRLSPLHGVPLAHKDIFRRVGRTMSCGSRILQDDPSEQHVTATAVERLEAAGAVTIGRLNLAEFAIGPTGENRHFGNCRNPWSLAHAPGGSSSGSAAAVAAGLVLGSLGSDTGGSARLPAAMCGVVGLKVTNSAVSRYGMMNLSRSLDCVGIIASTAEDVALLLAVVSGPDARDPACSPSFAFSGIGPRDRSLKGVRVGIPRNYYWDETSPQISAALAECLSLFRQLGAETIELTVPHHDVITALAGIVFASEAATVHAKWIHGRRRDYSDEVLARLEPGLCVPAHRYLQALHLRSTIAAEFVSDVFGQVDVLFTPALRRPVPTFRETASLSIPKKLELIAALTHCTRPINYLGLPALVAPCGHASDGLPIGCQLVGPPFAERLLLTLADRLEAARGGTSAPPMMASA